MKKLLALVLVLVVASTSFGALAQFKVTAINGMPYEGGALAEVHPSDIVTVAAVADFASNAVKAWHVNDNGLLPALGFVQAPYTLNAGYDLGRVIGNGANMNGALFAATATTSVNAFNGTTSGTVAANAVAFSFDYHVPNLPFSTEIVIEVLKRLTNDTTGIRTKAIEGSIPANTYIPVAPLTLHVVPEPMTMVLLGLGGLGLLRRRNA